MQINYDDSVKDKLIKSVIDTFSVVFSTVVLFVRGNDNRSSSIDKDAFDRLKIAYPSTYNNLADVIVYNSKSEYVLCIQAVTQDRDYLTQQRLKEIRESLKLQESYSMTVISAFPDEKALTRMLVRTPWDSVLWSEDNPNHFVHKI